MSTQDIRVVKLGGSLLDLPDLAARLRRWLGARPARPSAIIVGGGRLVDAVRQYDRLHALGDETAHWLAVQAMQVQARMVATLLPEATWAESVERLIAVAPPLSIVDPWELLRDDDRRLSPQPLPAGWQVTSDSIAARLAQLCGAAELVLLKSALPAEATLTAAASSGYVDAFFPRAATLPCVRCVNLRDEYFSEIRLTLS
ncbi:MAG TPA: hypothetical protein VJ783_11040 [Pirellulales bacterium]|nr:hypothetical protein [Pirellulales bacterium]